MNYQTEHESKYDKAKISIDRDCHIASAICGDNREDLDHLIAPNQDLGGTPPSPLGGH